MLQPAMIPLHALALFLVVVIPIWGYFHTQRLKRATDPQARLRTYRLTIAWQWTATIFACVMIGPRALVIIQLPASEGALVPGDIYGVAGVKVQGGKARRCPRTEGK